MNTIAETLRTQAEKHPDRIALRSKNARKGISYRDLYLLSGRVYAYLKKNGIGREDFVMILLPRDVCIPVCVAGILRAGAAFTVAEDSYPKERIEFIRKDVAPKLVITSGVYEEILREDPLSGHEDVGAHDACYAVYTSGSTGTPKGVLQEYGQIDSYLSSCYDVERVTKDFDNAICGLICPLSFMAAYVLIFQCVWKSACLYIISYDTVKNFSAFGAYLTKENINIVFMTPSMLRVFRPIPECLLLVIVGGEDAGNTYAEGVRVVNSYSSSESGTEIANFEIDRPYEKVPAGKNRGGMKLMLLEDDGQQAETGEICFENPYFRGYIHDEEKTRQAFSGGVYHTGDIGRFDEEGNLIVLGRKDDMIKINGNRIEPMEIERSLTELLGVGHAVAKGFHEQDRSFITAYFLKEELARGGFYAGEKLTLDQDALRARLLERIPYYMIPTYYEALDSFPMNANGKLDRKALRAPALPPAGRDVPEAANETEAYLRDLFSKVLKVGRVGPEDDFYQLGGDSLAAMAFMSECKLSYLTVNDLFAWRTPRKLAEYYRRNFGASLDPEERNRRALEKPQPALPETIDFFDANFFAPASTMYNLPLMLKLDRRVDAERFRAAVDRVLRHHPAYSTVFFFDEDTEIRQKYCPEKYEETPVIRLTGAEFERLQDTLVRRFDHLFGSLLYRKAIYQLDNGDTYFFLDTDHLISDGTSLNLVISQIDACYADPDVSLPTDYYYLLAEESAARQKKYASPENETRRHYEALMAPFFQDERFCPGYLPDGREVDLSKIQLIRDLEIDRDEARRYVKQNGITENEFFLCCCLLCVAKRNGYPKVALNFIHNGRNSNLQASSCGLLFHTHAVFADLTRYAALKDFYADIREQAEYGIRSGDFNCCALNDALSCSVFFLYQKDIFSLDRFPVVEKLITLPDHAAASDALMDFNVVDSSNAEKIGVKITCGNGFYQPETVSRLYQDFQEIAALLLRSGGDTAMGEILGAEASRSFGES